MFIAKGPLVRGYAIPDNLGDVAAASGQVRLFRSMTMMGGVQKIRFCIRGENHAQSNGGRLPELERRSTVAETPQNIFTGERNSSRGVQCSPLFPFPFLLYHQKPALPAATGRDRVMVTWNGVPPSTPLTTGAFFYSPLQPSRTLPLV